MMLRRLCFLCVWWTLMSLVIGEQPQAKGRVIGGSSPPSKKFKYMALLKKNGRFICGGSLITRRHVLTAKHCVATGSSSAYQVVLGEYRRLNSDGTEQMKAVRSICKHPSIDAAILFLSSSVTLNAAVQTIKLATTLPPVGFLTTVSGWGWTLSGVNSASNYIQYITLPRASTSACNAQGLNVKSHELCIGVATGNYINACHGDSGSPLVYPAYPNANPRQIGIVERSYARCPKKYHYAVFVSVPSIYSWIMDSCNILNYLPGTWTPWFDRDNPTGSGDWETRSSINPTPCGTKTPIWYQYARVSSTYCQTPHSECARSSNQVLTKSRTYGLSCRNASQKTIKKTSGWWWGKKTRYYKCRCCDYKIRFRCPL